MRPCAPLAAAALLCASAALAEEGMWLFNDFPSAEVARAHGFSPSQAWLDRLRLASVRLAGGCSGSFVSARGLVMTNHHCVRSCIEELSSAREDLLENGFYARRPTDERRCAKVELNQLVAIADVTAQVRAATAGKEGAAFHQALRAERARLEKACAEGARVRCDVVTLFHGGAYHLYRYRRFQDVRLAFAPEFPMAAFGGYPDNFNFPRYGFDVAFLRAWEGGAPAQTPDFLPFADDPAEEGDLVFVSGHPGGTERVQTAEQLAFQRDVALPYALVMLPELRGLLLEFQKGGPDRFRISRARTRSVENSMEALHGRHAFLADPEFFEEKVREDRALRERVKADPRLEARFGAAWPGIAEATRVHRSVFLDHRLLEVGDAFSSELFAHARRLVRAAAERGRPDAERLREYTDAQLPSLEQALFGAVPVHAPLEELTLSYSLRRFAELKGLDHPVVREVLGGRSPEAVARALVRGTALASAAARRALYEGGADAVDRSKDPMIALARAVDPAARAVRRTYEEQVDAALKRHGELLNQAHVAVHGTSGYPDATFTLRLSYGTVKGWTEDGRPIPALTRVEGLFARHTGHFPFAVAPSWLRAKAKLPPHAPMNLATTNDVVGGNSGSPLVDRGGRVVGLVFDGNFPSLGGRYGYEPETNRTVAVHAEVIRLALRAVYGAHRIADELAPAVPSGTAKPPSRAAPGGAERAEPTPTQPGRQIRPSGR